MTTTDLSDTPSGERPTAIRVEGLGKRYRIGAEERRSDTLAGTVAKMVRQPLDNLRRLRRLTSFADDEADDVIWALRDVDFTVGEGEIVGVIGKNGSGKSTLLKILSQITPPTRGRVELRGRVSSLLEVGTGFHPELTGRENIYLNGTILGMTKAEIDRKFDQIVDFAGTGAFLDTPVKRYSSGMRVRLAFSVAAHLEPEILLVDEVLAVGDVAFQRKCLGKMGEVARGGRTILFVSHNMGAISQLCERGILLTGGQIAIDSTARAAINLYLQQDRPATVHADFDDDGRPMVITRLAVFGGEGGSVLDGGRPFEITVDYNVRAWQPGTYVCVEVWNDAGVRLLWSSDVVDADALAEDREPGRYHARVEIPERLLAAGGYYVSAAIYAPGRPQPFDFREHAVAFEVIDTGSLLAQLGLEHPAVTALPLDWNTDRVADVATPIESDDR